MNYLKCEAERILNDLGYKYDENDIEIMVKTFNEKYNPDFSEYYYRVWWDVIREYYAEKR